MSRFTCFRLTWFAPLWEDKVLLKMSTFEGYSFHASLPGKKLTLTHQAICHRTRRLGCSMLGICLLVLAISTEGYTSHSPMEWETLGHEDGITSEGAVQPNSSLKAFRGTALIDAEIGRVISVLLDHRRAPEWVEGLQKSVELQAWDDHAVLVWQKFTNPWPIADRIFIYQATPEYNKETLFFRTQFFDGMQALRQLSRTEGEHIPDLSCCIVGKIVHAEWIFRSIHQNATCARVEVALDPKGWVPAVFVRWFQETWPHRTLAGLRKQVKKSDIPRHPEFGQWSTDLLQNHVTLDKCQADRFEQ